MEHMARTPKQIGNALRYFRGEKGLTQTQVGEKYSLRQATVSDLESGSPGIKLQTLCDVLAALDLELVIRDRTQMPKEKFADIF
jgi:HTH-type transcriptional regulator / antitoxin HipB